MSDSAEGIAGFVLAGGRSSRMGEDKALMELEGRPLIAHALEVSRTAGLAPKIAGARTDLSKFAQVIADDEDGRGPLAGVVSALKSTVLGWAVFLSVDMPLMAPELMGCLIRSAQATGAAITLTSVNGFAQTFPTVVRRKVLPSLHECLERDEGGCFSAFSAAAQQQGEHVQVLAAEALAQSGLVADARGLWPYQWFQNVNTPEDLEGAAAALLRAHRII